MKAQQVFARANQIQKAISEQGRTVRVPIGTELNWRKVRRSVRKLAEIFHVELEVDPYDHAAWREFVRGLEDEPERGARCPVCFHFSLERTARRAAALGANFATTLTVSPHKSSRVIFEVGARWNHFEPHDFKKKNGFLRSRELARQHGFYLQNFCGCEFTRRDG